MTYKHLIININGEEILILFMDYNFEISIFKKPIKSSIVSYIKKYNIKFNGKKILLSVGGLIIASLIYYRNDISFCKFENTKIIDYTDYFSSITDVPEIKLDEKDKDKDIIKSENDVVIKDTKTNIKKNKTIKKSEKSVISNNKTISKEKSTIKTNDSINVTVYKSNGEVITIDLEEYVIGVVAAEMPASFNIEALKVQAILARTYALKSIKLGKKLTDTVSTQAYIGTDSMKKKWGSEYTKYYTKIKNAVNSTKGLYVTYNGQIIDAVYHSTSNGFTENSLEVWGYSIPYLKSVNSEWDKNASPYERTITKSIEEIKKILEVSSIDNIEIIKRNSSGRVSLVKINDNEYSGVDLRTLLSLRSADFDIEIKDGNLVITTRGYGHGVGLSQYGSNSLANKGYNYEKIIKYYYSGVSINKL